MVDDDMLTSLTVKKIFKYKFSLKLKPLKDKLKLKPSKSRKKVQA